MRVGIVAVGLVFCVIFGSADCPLVASVESQHSAPVQLSKEAYSALMLYLKAVGDQAEKQDVETAIRLYRTEIPGTNSVSRAIKLASLRAVEAKFLEFPSDKMKAVKDSDFQFRAIEKQLRANPSFELSYELSYYRGMTYIHFPDFLKKKGLGMEDLQSAEKKVEQLNRHPIEKSTLFLNLAKLYLNNGNLKMAKEYAIKVIRLKIPVDVAEAKKIMKES